MPTKTTGRKAPSKSASQSSASKRTKAPRAAPLKRPPVRADARRPAKTATRTVPSAPITVGTSKQARLIALLGSATGASIEQMMQLTGWQAHTVRVNRVERFFALITDKAIRRGSFTSVKQLVQRIDQFVTHHNTNSQPFRWTATADSIL